MRSTRASRVPPRARWCSRSGSPTMSPHVIRGLSEEYGSWNTMCRSRRSGRIARRERCVMSTPFSRISPEVGSTSRSTQFATVDLPLPDSPTRPSSSPSWSSNETPSIACTSEPPPAMPPPTRKCLTRSRTSSASGRLPLFVLIPAPGGSTRRDGRVGSGGAPVFASATARRRADSGRRMRTSSAALVVTARGRGSRAAGGAHRRARTVVGSRRATRSCTDAVARR